MRFFEYYNVDEPMIELSEADARSRDTHVELVDAPILHYRVFFEDKLERAIYPEHGPDEAITKFHAEHYGQTRLWIVSPVQRDETGIHYDIWHYDSASARPSRAHHDNSSTLLLETHYDQDGRLSGSVERRFHEWGEHIETISRDASGRIVSIDD